jgi:hypothetical protein
MAVRAAAGGQQQLQVEPQAPLALQEIPPNLEKEEVTFLSIAKKLMFIVLKHQDKRDPLSNRLFMQGSAFALFMINDRSPDFPRDTFVAHFLGLKAIFREECRCENVSEPWLVGTKAWEKRELDLYCKALSHHSPRVIRSCDLGVPHPFGPEILNWMKELEGPMALLTAPRPNRELAIPAPTIAINELGVPVVVGLEERDEDLIAVLAAAGPDAHIDIRTANKVLVEFNKRMDEIIIERKKVLFTEDLKKQNALYASKLEAKNNQFDEDLTRLAESNKEEIACLTGSLNRTASNFNEALTERKKIEKALNQGLEKCEKELAEEKVKVAHQAIQIRGLEASNRWLNGRVNDLQGEVNSMDSDGPCVIS